MPHIAFRAVRIVGAVALAGSIALRVGEPNRVAAHMAVSGQLLAGALMTAIAVTLAVPATALGTAALSSVSDVGPGLAAIVSLNVVCAAVVTAGIVLIVGARSHASVNGIHQGGLHF
jgi:hypothetical protein